MYRKYYAVISLCLILSFMLTACGQKKDGTGDISNLQTSNEDFVEYQVKFYKDQLNEDFEAEEGDLFFVNDEVFKEHFFELSKDKPTISQNIDERLVYEVKKSDMYEIVLPEMPLLGQWTIDDNIDAQELVYYVPRDNRKGYRTGPLTDSTVNHRFSVKNAGDLKEIRFKMIDISLENEGVSFDEVEPKIEIVFKIK